MLATDIFITVLQNPSLNVIIIAVIYSTFLTRRRAQCALQDKMGSIG